MTKIAKSMDQYNDQNEEILDERAKLPKKNGAKQPDASNLLAMIAVLYAIFFISLIISKLMQ
jgi:hypothetical protein